LKWDSIDAKALKASGAISDKSEAVPKVDKTWV
jgi:hypothetical protein